MQKLYPDAAAALEGLLFDGMTICAGGFGLCGIPERLIDAIRDAGAKDLTIASNNAGIDGEGLGKLLRTRQVKKMISLLCRREQGVRAAISGRRARGRILPAGHACRALPRRRRGHSRLLHQDRRRHAGRRGQGSEESSTARNISSSAASAPTWRSSRAGRPTRAATSSSARPRATSTSRWRPRARICVAEVEEVVPVGALDPDCIHLPGIYVKRMIVGAPYDKKIEFRTVRERVAA